MGFRLNPMLLDLIIPFSFVFLFLQVFFGEIPAGSGEGREASRIISL